MFGGLISSITSSIYDVIERETKALEEEHAKTVGATPPQEQGDVQGAAGDEEDAPSDGEEQTAGAAAEPVTTLPWEGMSEEAIKQVRLLAKSKYNFTRDPPHGTRFEFDFERMLPSAMAALEADAELSKARFYLVPRFVKEPRFWRNYFYRISLIREALGEEVAPSSSTSSTAEVACERKDVGGEDIAPTVVASTGREEEDAACDDDDDLAVLAVRKEEEDEDDVEERVAAAAAPILFDDGGLDFLSDEIGEIVCEDAEFDDAQWRQELESIAGDGEELVVLESEAPHAGDAITT